MSKIKTQKIQLVCLWIGKPIVTKTPKMEDIIKRLIEIHNVNVKKFCWLNMHTHTIQDKSDTRGKSL